MWLKRFEMIICTRNILYLLNNASVLFKQEIIANPKFTVDGFSRFDLLQGKIGKIFFTLLFIFNFLDVYNIISMTSCL